MLGESILRSAQAWFRSFRNLSPGQDMLAALTLWGMLVPEGMAYAGMAGLPVQAGLYTLLASLPLYFIFGGSPVLVCAATSSESIMVAAIIAPLAGADPARYAALTACLVLLTGTIFLLAGLLRLGRITSFLSKPVMTGFIFGLAIYIAQTQFHKILGLPHTQGHTLGQFVRLLANLGQCNPAALAVGLGSLALLFGCERCFKRFPAGLLVLGLGVAVSRIFDLSARGVGVVKDFPLGLPSFYLPHIDLADFSALAPAALGLALVAFSQALGAEECYAERYGHQLDADQELKALGLANLGSAGLGGILAGGSMSSTAVNASAGAGSKLSGLFTAAMIALSLAYFAPLFRGLPEPVLGAVVLHAVVRLMKVSELARYRRVNFNEFLLALLALSGVVLLNILPGLVLAVAASLLRVVIFARGIEISEMGPVKDTPGLWVSRNLHPEAGEVRDVLALRMEGALFFANAEEFHARVSQLCGNPPRYGAVALQLKGNRKVCITSADMLARLVRELRGLGLVFAFVELSPDTHKVLSQAGVISLVGQEHLFVSFEQAVEAMRVELARRKDEPGQLGTRVEQPDLNCGC